MSTYQIFDRDNDVVENQRTTISSGLWTGGSGTLTAAFTQSTNGNITGSFLELYNEDPNQSSSAETQFAIGYAHVHGSGSKGNVSKLTTGGRQSAALYRQFRNLILAPNTDEFTFTGHSGTSEDFYFISFQRARQREKIDPGNWELQLSGQMAGRAAKIQLIDDSGATTNPTVEEGGRVFNVVSGSIANGIKTTAANQPGGGLGLFYPDLGIILLDAAQMEASGGLTANARDADQHISRSEAFFDVLVSGSSFQARREEEISSTNYFVRANNKDFNFSANPTFSTGSTEVLNKELSSKTQKLLLHKLVFIMITMNY